MDEIDLILRFGCDKPGGRPLSPTTARELAKHSADAVCAVKSKKDGRTLMYRRKGKAEKVEHEQRLGKHEERLKKQEEKHGKTKEGTKAKSTLAGRIERGKKRVAELREKIKGMGEKKEEGKEPGKKWVVDKPEPTGPVAIKVVMGKYAPEIEIEIKGRKIKGSWPHQTESKFANAIAIPGAGIMKDGKPITHLSVPPEVIREIKSEFNKKNADILKESLYLKKTKHGYEITNRLNSNDWSKVSKHMERHGVYDPYSDDEDDMKYIWRVKPGHEEDVEKALDILPHNRRSVREPQVEAAHKVYVQNQERIKEITKSLDTHFDPKKAEFPGQSEGKDIPIPEGETYGDFNIYGGGEKWVITNDAIWHLRNNGADGDDWSYNNIKTGGAGAIGRKWPKTEEGVKVIRELMKLKKGPKDRE